MPATTTKQHREKRHSYPLKHTLSPSSFTVISIVSHSDWSHTDPLWQIQFWSLTIVDLSSWFKFDNCDHLQLNISAVDWSETCTDNSNISQKTL